jgi:hypothetical protein
LLLAVTFLLSNFAHNLPYGAHFFSSTPLDNTFSFPLFGDMILPKISGHPANIFSPNVSSPKDSKQHMSRPQMDPAFSCEAFLEYPEENVNPDDETERWEFDQSWMRLRQKFLFKWWLQKTPIKADQEWHISRILKSDRMTTSEKPELLVSDSKTTAFSSTSQAGQKRSKDGNFTTDWPTAVGEILQSASVAKVEWEIRREKKEKELAKRADEGVGRVDKENADARIKRSGPTGGKRGPRPVPLGMRMENTPTRDKRSFEDIWNGTETPRKRSKLRHEFHINEPESSSKTTSPTDKQQPSPEIKKPATSRPAASPSHQKAVEKDQHNGHSILNEVEDVIELNTPASPSLNESDGGDIAEDGESDVGNLSLRTLRPQNRKQKAQMATPTKSPATKSFKISTPNGTPKHPQQKSDKKDAGEEHMSAKKMFEDFYSWVPKLDSEAAMSPDGKSNVSDDSNSQEDDLSDDDGDAYPGESYPEMPFYDPLRPPPPEFESSKFLYRNIKTANERRIEQTVYIFSSPADSRLVTFETRHSPILGPIWRTVRKLGRGTGI